MKVSDWSFFTGAVPSKQANTKYRYKAPQAVVYGTEHGVPFRRVFKTLKCAEKFAAAHFAELVRLG